MAFCAHAMVGHSVHRSSWSHCLRNQPISRALSSWNDFAVSRALGAPLAAATRSRRARIP
eukprot:143170-Chlamydomonas_euryale.AAC.1